MRRFRRGKNRLVSSNGIKSIPLLTASFSDLKIPLTRQSQGISWRLKRDEPDTSWRDLQLRELPHLEDDNRQERFRVTSKLAVHGAGKINAADEVLFESASDSTQKNMSSAKLDDLRGRDGVPPGHKEKICA